MSRPWLTSTNGHAPLLELVHLGQALPLEGGVPNGQDLVHQQDIGVTVDRYRETQAHVHAGRVAFHWRV